MGRGALAGLEPDLPGDHRGGQPEPGGDPDLRCLPPHPQNPVYMSNLSWSAAGRAEMLAFCMTTPALLQCYALGYMASAEFVERGREFMEMMGTKIRRPVWGVTVGELRESTHAAENWKAEEAKAKDRQASTEPDADQARPQAADTGGSLGSA